MRGGWSCPFRSPPAWGRDLLLTGPRQLHLGGTGKGWRAGTGLSVRLSVSTHHRAQSLFPRLKPSQLKSSKPRAVGATPPPVEERDRCSREGGRGGGPAKLVGGPCPTLDMHLQPSTTCHSLGPTDRGTRLGEDRRGTRQAEAIPSVRPHPLAALSPPPANPAALRELEASLQGVVLLSQCLPQDLPWNLLPRLPQSPSHSFISVA